jgi:hypothetical protein
MFTFSNYPEYKIRNDAENALFSNGVRELQAFTPLGNAHPGNTMSLAILMQWNALLFFVTFSRFAGHPFDQVRDLPFPSLAWILRQAASTVPLLAAISSDSSSFKLLIIFDSSSTDIVEVARLILAAPTIFLSNTHILHQMELSGDHGVVSCAWPVLVRTPAAEFSPPSTTDKSGFGSGNTSY